MLVAFGALVAGVLLALCYVRRHAEPGVTVVRRLHTGSVNDYAAYSVVGLVATTGVLLLR
jgi:multicomponent Na+:H+ antiporter subunit D